MYKISYPNSFYLFAYIEEDIKFYMWVMCMDILAVLLFAICANLDNVVIGISYGIKKIKISLFSNFVIAILTTVGTVISMLLGRSFMYILPVALTKCLGSILLILIGGYYIIKYLYIRYSKRKKAEWYFDEVAKYDKDSSGDISIKEAVILSLTLTINNLTLGIGIGTLGFSIVVSSIIVFIFSFITIYIGNFIGNGIFSKILGKYAEPISGLIILFLGVIGLFLY